MNFPFTFLPYQILRFFIASKNYSFIFHLQALFLQIFMHITYSNNCVSEFMKQSTVLFIFWLLILLLMCCYLETSRIKIPTNMHCICVIITLPSKHNIIIFAQLANLQYVLYIFHHKGDVFLTKTKRLMIFLCVHMCRVV